MATVLCHAEMGTDCPMYHFMGAELRLKVKTFTTLVTLKGFIQVSVHVFLRVTGKSNSLLHMPHINGLCFNL